LAASGGGGTRCAAAAAAGPAPQLTPPQADSFNLFDGTIVILSLVEILMSAATGSSGGGIASTFRAFRLLRIFKMAKSWTALNNIIDSFGKALPKLGYVKKTLLLPLLVLLLRRMLHRYRYRYRYRYTATATTPTTYDDDYY
jgi:hypothetical protein